MSARPSVLGRPGGRVADDLECLFGGLDRPEEGLLNPEQRESQLILGELEHFLAPLVLKLTPCLQQLAQLRIVRRDLTRELPPGLEVVAADGRLQEQTTGQGANLLALSMIELLKLPALLSDLDREVLAKHPDLAQPLLNPAHGLGSFPVRCLQPRFAQVLLSLRQRPLGLGQLFPEQILARILALEVRERTGVLSPARLGQRPDRLSQHLPRPRPPDVPGEHKQNLRVPIERLGKLYQRLSSGPLDLARLDPADLRSRQAAPPRQPSHRDTRPHARLPGQPGHSHPGQRVLILHHDDQV